MVAFQCLGLLSTEQVRFALEKTPESEIVPNFVPKHCTPLLVLFISPRLARLRLFFCFFISHRIVECMRMFVAVFFGKHLNMLANKERTVTLTVRGVLVSLRSFSWHMETE